MTIRCVITCLHRPTPPNEIHIGESVKVCRIVAVERPSRFSTRAPMKLAAQYEARIGGLCMYWIRHLPAALLIASIARIAFAGDAVWTAVENSNGTSIPIHISGPAVNALVGQPLIGSQHATSVNSLWAVDPVLGVIGAQESYAAATVAQAMLLLQGFDYLATANRGVPSADTPTYSSLSDGNGNYFQVRLPYQNGFADPNNSIIVAGTPMQPGLQNAEHRRDAWKNVFLATIIQGELYRDELRNHAPMINQYEASLADHLELMRDSTDIGQSWVVISGQILSAMPILIQAAQSPGLNNIEEFLNTMDNKMLHSAGGGSQPAQIKNFNRLSNVLHGLQIGTIISGDIVKQLMLLSMMSADSERRLHAMESWIYSGSPGYNDSEIVAGFEDARDAYYVIRDETFSAIALSISTNPDLWFASFHLLADVIAERFVTAMAGRGVTAAFGHGLIGSVTAFVLLMHEIDNEFEVLREASLAATLEEWLSVYLRNNATSVSTYEDFQTVESLAECRHFLGYYYYKMIGQVYDNAWYTHTGFLAALGDLLHGGTTVDDVVEYCNNGIVRNIEQHASFSPPIYQAGPALSFLAALAYSHQLGQAVEPMLAASPSQLYFTAAQGQDPAEQYLSIQNAGDGALSWTATTSDPRIEVFPATGTAPSGPLVRIDSSGFDVGTDTFAITITSPTALNSPAIIPVQLTINSNQVGNQRTPVADTYYYEGSPASSYGGHPALKVGSTNQLRYHSFVQFNLSNIAGADIASATLKLYCNAYNYPLSMVVDRLTTPWSEQENGNELAGYQRSFQAVSRSSIGAGWEEWPVGPMVQSWADGQPNYGFVVYTNDVYQSGGTPNSFDARTEANPPVLEIVLCEGVPNLDVSTPRPDNGATAPPFVVGQGVRWWVTVSNQGTGCAPDYNIDYYLENSPGTLLNRIGTDSGSSLLGGRTREENLQYTFAPADIGSPKYLVAHLRGTARKAAFGPFEVRDNTPCQLAVTQPADGAQWTAGRTHTITWTTGNCGAFVRIELLHNSVPCRIIASSTDNDGSFDCPAEGCGANSSGYSVRIVDLVSGNSGVSAGEFEILPPPFESMHAGLTGVYYGDAVWGDYDGDGSLDVAVSGAVDAYTGLSVSRVYHNDGQGHFSMAAELPGVWKAALAWGDFDNDGDLDLVLTGKSGEAYLARIFRYESGSFVEIGAADDTLVGTWQGAAAWGDYDNDGDLDLVLTGSAGARIYRNDSQVFNAAGDALMGADSGSATWVDYNRDGYLDLFLMPQFGSPRLFRNSGGAFTDSGVSLPAVFFARAAWGDFDNDGYPEVAISSLSTMGARIYENNAGAIGDIVCDLPGGWYGSVAWGDYDSDGDLDLAVTGNHASEGFATRVYGNEDGTFVDIGANLPDLAVSSASWGDCNGDGKLDLLLSGTTGSSLVAEIYRNNATAVNAPPSAPTALQHVFNGDQVTVSWSSSLDAETPAPGLSYNLRVGVTPGGCEVMPPMAGVTNGARRIPAPGNVQQRTSWTLTLPPRICYWSVQAIDGAWAGSTFAPEQTIGTAPESPGSVVVTPAEVVVGKPFTISWPAIEGAVLYLVARDNEDVATVSTEQYTVPSATMGDAGTYSVRACNQYGCSAPSIGATIVVLERHGVFGSSIPFALNTNRIGFGTSPAFTIDLISATGLPMVTALGRPYPNPFNPVVNIPFALGKNDQVNIAIYDISGCSVKVLLSEPAQPGRHMLVWDGRDASGRRAASGVYFVRFESSELIQVERVVLLK